MGKFFTDKDTKKILQDALAGGAAGGIATTVMNPIENIQIRQIQNRKLVGAPVSISLIAKELFLEGKKGTSGLRGILKGLSKGLYQGTGTKLLKVVPTMALTFPIYQIVVKSIAKKK